jgi:hypothetical protein
MSDGLPPKGLFANLSKSAGAATKMVALQTERTKLATMTLPAAYRALGKDCLQQKRHLDCITELTEQLRSVLAEIKKLAEAGAAQPAPQSFTDKATVARKYAFDAARQKQLSMKRDSLLRISAKQSMKSTLIQVVPWNLFEQSSLRLLVIHSLKSKWVSSLK